MTPAIGPFFQKRWLRLWLPEESATLSIQTNSLQSANGFRSQTESSALFTRRSGPDDNVRRFFREVHVNSPSPKNAPRKTGAAPLFFDAKWEGKVKTNEGSLEWSLSSDLRPRFDSIIPAKVRRPLALQGEFTIPVSEVFYSGEIKVADSVFKVNHAQALLGTVSGSRPWKESFWFACPTLKNVAGGANLSVSVLTFRDRPWKFLWESQIRFFRILYDGKTYETRSLWDCMQSRLTSATNGCDFEFSRGDLVFRGKLQSRLKDQTGLSFESTDGTLLHTVSSNEADLEIQVFRGQKLEATFSSKGETSYEKSSREKDPYAVFLM